MEGDWTIEPVTEEAGAVMEEGDIHLGVQSRFLAKA